MMCSAGFAHTGLTYGLSRMTGNCHVRFLGEGAAAMPLPYPTQPSICTMSAIFACLGASTLKTPCTTDQMIARSRIHLTQGRQLKLRDVG